MVDDMPISVKPISKATNVPPKPEIKITIDYGPYSIKTVVSTEFKNKNVQNSAVMYAVGKAYGELQERVKKGGHRL